MQIDGARFVPGGLLLETTDPEARKIAYQFRAGEYELRRRRKGRSLDANAYAWVLIDKIAAAVGLTKTEVYRNAIREIGGVSERVCVPRGGVDRLRESWTRNGEGWQAITGASKIPGCATVTLYYGSSVYDTAQMSRLIDILVQDAKALGIETLPPWKLEGMIDDWQTASSKTGGSAT